MNTLTYRQPLACNAAITAMIAATHIVFISDGEAKLRSGYKGYYY
ncbi:MAG: hypothetical protein ACO1PI_06595 [Bacteroidota bacterium]